MLGLKGRPILVTGSSGFIGSRVVADLRREGIQLRLLVRSGPAPATDADVVVGDLTASEVIGEAVQGVGAVIHLAGYAHAAGGDPTAIERFRRTNSEVSRSLARAAAAAGVDCFVFVSSIAAAVSPPTPYGQSKRLAEAGLDEIRQANGMRIISLRPPVVYGPGMKGNPLLLFRWIWRERPIPVVPGVRRSTLYVGNLSHAIRQTLDASYALPTTLMVCDGPAFETRCFIERSAHALGKQPRIVPLPARALRLAAGVAERLPRFLHGPATADKLDRLSESIQIDPTEQISFLGDPPYSVDDGLAETAAWFRTTMG